MTETPLRSYLKRTGQTAEAFASEHGLSPWNVRHWARGDKHPHLDAQRSMEIASGGSVTPQAWLEFNLARRPASESAAA